MRYADGELDPEQEDEIERTLAEDPEALAVVEGVDQLGDWVRALAEQSSSQAGDIAGEVMARIESAEQASDSPPESGGRVIPGWFFPGVAAGLAAAAAVAIWLASPSDPVAPLARPAPTTEPVAPVAPAPPAPEQEPAEEEDTGPAVAIESVDFGSHNGAIFMVSAGNEATPVVWLTDDAAEGGDRTEPL
jgi:anti-sigma factor RsiW